MTRTEDFFSSHSSIPQWAIGSTIITRDDGTDRNRGGEFGYECHQLIRDGREIGYVYDDGAGYAWCEGQRPEPRTQDERGQ